MCKRCNSVIRDEDVAFINNDAYCHPMLSSAPSCYMKATWDQTGKLPT